MIPSDEYLSRMTRLQARVAAEDIDAFLVSGKDSIYYLTGVSYNPLERPFFIIVRPDGPSVLLVPELEKTHLKTAPNVGAVHSYWDYPSRKGEGYLEKLHDLLSGISVLLPPMKISPASAL